MKKIGLILVTLVLALTTACADDRIVSPESLPQKAKELIAVHFPGKTVQYVEKEFKDKFAKKELEIAELKSKIVEEQNSKKTVIKNIDGKAYKDSDDVKDILSKHITNPVRFEAGIKEMLDMGIDTFVEIGPGKILSGFVKKINKDVKVLNINNSESLKLTLKELSI